MMFHKNTHFRNAGDIISVSWPGKRLGILLEELGEAARITEVQSSLLRLLVGYWYQENSSKLTAM